MIREPIVAGRFYEADPASLKQQIDSCIKHPLGPGIAKPSACGRLLAMIVPHAGFVFSGPVAAHGFARLAVETPTPETIILLGPKHTRYGESFSVSAASAWNTPLGTLEVDSELRDRVIAGVSMLRSDNEAHAMEHSLEVELPFIQCFLEKKPRILPIALHYAPYKTIAAMADDLRKVIEAETKRNILLLASSDFSHDTPRSEAYQLDRQVIDRVLALDAEGFYDLIVEEDRSVCGLMPITAMLKIIAGQKVSASLLKYATSMDVMRHDRGVGYASLIFEKA